jgi:hypothetical protein
MTDLFDRLYPTDPSEENISVHYLFAALVDYAMGETTRQQIIDYWLLDTEAQADLDILCDAIDALSSTVAKLSFATELHAVMQLAEGGAKYNTKSAFATRLGL